MFLDNSTLTSIGRSLPTSNSRSISRERVLTTVHDVALEGDLAPVDSNLGDVPVDVATFHDPLSARQKGRGFWSKVWGFIMVAAVVVLCGAAAFFAVGPLVALGMAGWVAALTAGSIAAIVGANLVLDMYRNLDNVRSFIDQCAPWLRVASEKIVATAEEGKEAIKKLGKTAGDLANGLLGFLSGLAQGLGNIGSSMKYVPYIIIGGLALWALK